MRQRVTWIALIAVAWLLIGAFVRTAAELVLQWVPFASDVAFGWMPTMAELGAVAATSAAAFLVVKFVRANIGAPSDSWFGVLVAVVLTMLPAVVGIVVFAQGARPEWLDAVVITGDAGPLPMTVQLTTFVLREALPAAAIVWGAWLGSRATVAPTSPARA